MRRIGDDAVFLRLDVGKTTGENVVRVELGKAAGVVVEVVSLLLQRVRDAAL